ncbi:DUF488 domain-containing protein [Pseudogracilibacillus sp. SO30301A]|uniref:DUF488 domain-containing protein n=1 Tax=Pseudogracilibacillus sp. SO30301A TaxID=3098291 RepID=UPI00300E59AA
MRVEIKLKRIYDKSDQDDGIRILIDRLWPRGISKEEAKLDYWLKDLAPSNNLRKWFNHDPIKFAEFTKRYQEELKTGEQMKAFKELKEIISKNNNQRITLLYAAKDIDNNNAQVIKQLIQ